MTGHNCLVYYINKIKTKSHKISINTCHYIVVAVIVLMSFGAESIYAGEGDCANLDFKKFTRRGKLEWFGDARIARESAPVFDSASSRKIRTHLKFDTMIKVSSESGNRIEVKHLGHRDPIGWVDKSLVMCRTKPLRGIKGLERKAFIRTKSAPLGESQPTVTARQNPEESRCTPTTCKELTRFRLYLVFDEHEGYLLLGDQFRLDEKSRLIGWVNKNDVYPWNTAYALRPTDKPGNRKICAYITKEDARAKRNCIFAEGGDVWYTVSYRAPLLDKEDGMYKVAFPAWSGESRGNRDAVTFSAASFKPKNLSALSGKQFKDVFFLIDGTKSMQPAINAVVGKGETENGVVDEIINAMRTNPELSRNSKFRYGFRIYRDDYAKDKNLGDGLPLAEFPCEPNEYEQTVNALEFQKELGLVSATSNDRDDYPENLYGGMLQALTKDMRTCPNHAKYLFVIGDAGYDKNAISKQDIVDELIRKTATGKERTFLFFVRTPNYVKKEEMRGDPAEYLRAYRLFEEQGTSLLDQIEMPRDIFYLSGDFRTLSKDLTESLKKMSEVPVSAITIDLRNGASFSESMRLVRERFPDTPPVFLEVLRDSIETELGEQKYNRIYDSVRQGYIPFSEDFVEEVWMTKDELRQWTNNILAGFEDINQYSGPELRHKLASSLVNGLQNVIKEPPLGDTDETLQEYSQRGRGLPVRENSPLLSYRYKEYMDKQLVPDCEIGRLATWGYRVRQIMNILIAGTDRPVLDQGDYLDSHCPDVSEKGKRIPWIRSDPDSVPLCPGNRECRYDHALLGTKIYWIPAEYLP